MDEQLKTLIKSENGKLLHDFLLEEYKKFSRIDYVREYETDKAQALEFKSHKKALQIVGDILCKIIDIREEKGPEDVKPEDTFD